MSQTTPAPPPTATRAPLGVRFWLVWVAGAVSFLGDGVIFGALPLLALRATHDPRLIALIEASSGAGWLLMGLISGVVVDRTHRLKLMWRTDLFRALALTVFILWLLTGDADRSPGIAGIVGIALLLGLCAPFFDNAEAAVLPQIVPGARLEAANALTQVSASVGGQLLGPALGAALVVLDPTWPMTFDAISFLAAALLVATAARIRPGIGPPERTGETSHLRADLRQGWHALMNHRALRACSVLIALSNALVAGATAVLVLYVVDVLHLPEASFGLFVAVMAAGGITGALLAPVLIARLGQRRVLRHGLLLVAAGFLGSAATTTVPLVLVSIAAAGAGLLSWNVAAVSYRQRVVPGNLLGRVTSVYRVIAVCAMPIGAVGAGFLAHAIGIRETIATGAVGLLLAVLAAGPALATVEPADARRS